MASHEPTGSIIKTHNTSNSVTPNLKTPKSHTSQQIAKIENSFEYKVKTRPTRKEIIKRGLCFNCLEKGHTSKACSKPKNSKSDKRPTHVSTCAVSPAAPPSVQLSHKPVTKDSKSSSNCMDYDEYISLINSMEITQLKTLMRVVISVIGGRHPVNSRMSGGCARG